VSRAVIYEIFNDFGVFFVQNVHVDYFAVYLLCKIDKFVFSQNLLAPQKKPNPVKLG